MQNNCFKEESADKTADVDICRLQAWPAGVEIQILDYFRRSLRQLTFLACPVAGAQSA
jgi:hypothetical protein